LGHGRPTGTRCQPLSAGLFAADRGLRERCGGRKYAPHVEYFFHKPLYTPQYYQAIPGYQDHPSLVRGLQAPLRERFDLRALKYLDFVERGLLIAGSAAIGDQAVARSLPRSPGKSGPENGVPEAARAAQQMVRPGALERPPLSGAP